MLGGTAERPVGVVLVGAGLMGRGLARHLYRQPRFRLLGWANRGAANLTQGMKDLGLPGKVSKTQQAAGHNGPVWLGQEAKSVIKRAVDEGAEVLVDATYSVHHGLELAEQAMAAGLHLVLINAELLSLLGPWLKSTADARGLIVTGDAGDQHGVLARMAKEARAMGFKPRLAGNIKGFENRYATPDTLVEEAAKRRLSTQMCCAFTDGTKLGLEMSLVANALGMTVAQPGMTGPRLTSVQEAMTAFDLHALPPEGQVDYILGAEPGGGVFLIVEAEDLADAPYLSYFKMGEGPFYLLYRPFHLCHMETPFAIWAAAREKRAVVAPWAGQVTDVYAYAKRDLKPGDSFTLAVGGADYYGLIEQRRDGVPIALLEAPQQQTIKIKRAIKKDASVTWDDLALPQSRVLSVFQQQKDLPA